MVAMDEFPFPVQRSLLSASALAERMLTHYNLPGSPDCRFWHRSINDLYLVEVGGKKLVLRVCPTNWRSFEQLAAEIDLLRFLHQRGICVPQPIPDRDGTYVQALNAPEGPRYAVVFTFVPGTPPGPSEAHSYRFGQAIAQLHTVTNDYPEGRAGFRFEPEDMVDEPLARLRPFFVEHQDELDYLLEISRDLRQVAGSLPQRAPEYGICHGDVNDSNLHIGERGQWTLLDFEYFGYGWRVLDIATFINNQIHRLGEGEQAKSVLGAFLEGYRSTRPLSEAELETLPSFVIMRQIWLLGIGAKNYPNIGLRLFEDWLFGQCMPFIRAWMAGPFWEGGLTKLL